MKHLLLIPAFFITVFSGCAQINSNNKIKSATKMPFETNSVLTGISQSTNEQTFSFIPQTPEIKITLINTNIGSNHIHTIFLYEYTNSFMHLVRHDSYDSVTQKNLTITLHEAVLGKPYYISTSRQQTNCLKCKAPVANFNIQAQSIKPPFEEIKNGVVYIDGKPSYRSNEIIISVNDNDLIANNNKTSKTGIVSDWLNKDIIRSIAKLLCNGNIFQAENLAIEKVLHNQYSAEVMVLTVPKNTKIFYASRALSLIKGIGYAEPNYVFSLEQ